MVTQQLNLNTGDGQVVFTTDSFNEKLDGIVIDSDNKVEIIIQSELGYEILNLREHVGVNYYAPRAILRQPTKSILGHDQFDRFHLDERLVIIIRGGKNREVSLDIRLS